MATQEKQRTKTESNDTLSVDIRDHELQQTLNDFLDEEQRPEKPGILVNFANAAGFGLLAVGALYLLRTLGLSFLPDVSDSLEILPVIGGILISILGFGFFTYERKLKKLEKKRLKNKVPIPSQFENTLRPSVSSDLKTGTAPGIDSYALKQRKRLYKSITNKKIFGVCGGIAKFFGVEPTVIRFIFAVATVLGYGSSIIIYLALAIALSKEPPELAGLSED